MHLDLQERNHEAVLEIKGTEKLRKRARKYIKYVSIPPGCTPASLCGCRVGLTIFMGFAGGQKPAFEAPRSWSALGLHVGDSTADGSDPLILTHAAPLSAEGMDSRFRFSLSLA